MSEDIDLLIEAIIEEYIPFIQMMLDTGIDVNVIDDTDEAPLHYAVRHNIEILEMLLEYGADPDIMTEFSGTPLHRAVNKNDVESVKMLLEYGADVCAISEDGASGEPLQQAKSRDMVLLLLKHGACVNDSDSHGYTALHSAVTDNNIDVCKVLIDHGAPIEARSHSGWTPLHIAVWNGHTELVDLLLSKGASANSRVIGCQGFSSGWTPMSWEAAKPLKEIECVLLRNSWTPLHLAAIKNRDIIIQRLVKNGAKVNATIDEYSTPLHWATLLNSKKAIDALKKYKAI